MTSRLDGLNRLREDTDVLLQRMQRIDETAGPVEVADPSGAITVRLATCGEVEWVRIGFGWRDRIGAQRLPATILATVAAARDARLEAWGRAAEESAALEPPRPRPLTDPPRSPQLHQQVETLSPEDATSLLAEIEDGIEAVEELLDQHAEAEYVGHSASRRVRVTADSSGVPVSIEFDPAWLDRAHEANLSRECTQAIHAAHREAGENGLLALLEAAGVADLLGRLGNDPHTSSTEGAR